MWPPVITTARWWTWVRRLAVLVALAAVAVAFAQTWDRTRGLPFASVPRLAASAVFLAAALLVAGRVWCHLVGVPPRRILPGFLLAQLGKYVPGAVWQAVGQVTAAAQDGVSAARGGAAYLVMVLVQVVAGAVVALPLAFIDGVPVAVRVVAAIAPLSALLLHRAWMRRALTVAGRWRRLAHLDDETLPRQRAILAAAGEQVVVFVLLGIALQLALPAPADASATVGIIAAHGLAWVAGFLVVPVPAGLGVREAALVLAAGWHADAGTLIAGSVVMRLLQIATEAVVAGAARITTGRRATSAGAPHPEDQ